MELSTCGLIAVLKKLGFWGISDFRLGTLNLCLLYGLPRPLSKFSFDSQNNTSSHLQMGKLRPREAEPQNKRQPCNSNPYLPVGKG
jgi:hypothetical protein